jgi:Uma2 family endonuclease
MSVQPKVQPSFDDWLADERAAFESRSEYVNGEVFAMTGASEAHNLIVTNTVRELDTQMKARPCRVYANDMKVRIRATTNAVTRIWSPCAASAISTTAAGMSSSTRP